MTIILDAEWRGDRTPEPETLRDLREFRVAGPARVLVPRDGGWWLITSVDVSHDGGRVQVEGLLTVVPAQALAAAVESYVNMLLQLP